MYETRHQFREDLKELERQTLEEIDVVVAQLDRALASLRNHDSELAELVVAAEVRIDARCLEIHQGVLLLLARQTPVAGDLRILAALLHVIRYVERIGAQCANIAKLVPLSGNEPTTDKQLLEAIEQMGQLARRQLTQAKDTLKTRDVVLARDLVSKDAGSGRLNRELFNRAVEIGDEDLREQTRGIQRHCHPPWWRRRADPESNCRPAGLTGLPLVARRHPRTFGVT